MMPSASATPWSLLWCFVQYSIAKPCSVDGSMVNGYVWVWMALDGRRGRKPGRLHKIASQIPTNQVSARWDELNRWFDGRWTTSTTLCPSSADLCVEGGGMVLPSPSRYECESGNRCVSHVAELRRSIGVHRLVSGLERGDVH